MHNSNLKSVITSIMLMFFCSQVEALKTYNNLPTQQILFKWLTDLTTFNQQEAERQDYCTTMHDELINQYIVSKLDEFGFEHIQHQHFTTKKSCYSDWFLSIENVKPSASFFVAGTGSNRKNDRVFGDLSYIGSEISDDSTIKNRIVIADLVNNNNMSVKKIANFIYDPIGVIRSEQLKNLVQSIPTNFPNIIYEAQLKQAKAFIGILKDNNVTSNEFYPDFQNIPNITLPALFVSKETGEYLLRIMDKSTIPLAATLKIDTSNKKLSASNIIATLEGQTKDTILLSSHYDIAGGEGAVSTASGLVTLLGLAKYYSKIPKKNRDKTFVFAFYGGHYSTHGPTGAQFFAESYSNSLLKDIVLSFNIDNIALKFIPKDGIFVNTGTVQPRLLFHPPNEFLLKQTKHSLEILNYHTTVLVQANQLSMPETAKWLYLKSIPTFCLTSQPEYLHFLEYDTLDKVALDELLPTLKLVISVVDKAIHSPKSWLSTVNYFF